MPTLTHTKNNSQENSSRSTIPDAKAARALPITDVVDALPIERHGNMIECWKPDNHQHGDRTPSVGIFIKRNRVKCFGTGCNPKSLGPVDLTMDVMNWDFWSALSWLDRTFHLPHIPAQRAGRPRVERHFGRVGVGGRLEALVRSGVWGQLSASEIRLLGALDALADPQSHTVSDADYRTLRHYSGIADREALAAAIDGLEEKHIIAVTRGHGGYGGPIRNSYVLTLEDARLLARMRAEFERDRIAVRSDHQRQGAYTT